MRSIFIVVFFIMIFPATGDAGEPRDSRHDGRIPEPLRVMRAYSLVLSRHLSTLESGRIEIPRTHQASPRHLALTLRSALRDLEADIAAGRIEPSWIDRSSRVPMETAKAVLEDWNQFVQSVMTANPTPAERDAPFLAFSLDLFLAELRSGEARWKLNGDEITTRLRSRIDELKKSAAGRALNSISIGPGRTARDVVNEALAMEDQRLKASSTPR